MMAPASRPACDRRARQSHRWSVVRAGVVDDATLARLSPYTIVFVCTGNTCRSPLAEALFKKKLADRLGCPVEELSRRGFLVISAGLAAMMGAAAADEAVEAAQDYGADLSGHLSRPLTGRTWRRRPITCWP